jgi:hypothetical protein
LGSRAVRPDDVALREISSHDLSYYSQPKAADFLRILKSLQRGGTGAWDRLWQAPGGDQSLGELEATLCERRPAPDHDHDDDDDDERVWSWRPGSRESNQLRMPASGMRGSDAMRGGARVLAADASNDGTMLGPDVVKWQMGAAATLHPILALWDQDVDERGTRFDMPRVWTARPTNVEGISRTQVIHVNCHHSYVFLPPSVLGTSCGGGGVNGRGLQMAVGEGDVRHGEGGVNNRVHRDGKGGRRCSSRAPTGRR